MRVLLIIIIIFLILNFFKKEDVLKFYYPSAKYIREGFTKLSKDLFNFSNHDFNIGGNMIDFNNTFHTHLPTNWAVCDSYITTLNNKIISNYIIKNAEELIHKPHNVCSLT